MNSMKRRDWLKAGLAVLGAAGLARLPLVAAEGEKTFSNEFAPDWEVQKAYTLEVAEAMPADKYNFKPTEVMRSFAELMAHVGGSIYMFSAAVRGVEPPAAMKPPEQPSKEALVAFLTGAFDYATETIASLDDKRAHETLKLFGDRLSMEAWKVCHFMRDHVTHHRGYALPYLRLNSIEPPHYRFAGTRPSPV